jgi:hypothetical protein
MHPCKWYPIHANGSTLKLSFRRIFSTALMERWYELEQIISSVVYRDDCDSLICNYNTDGKYSSSSMYKIISFRGGGSRK